MRFKFLPCAAAAAAALVMTPAWAQPDQPAPPASEPPPPASQPAVTGTLTTQGVTLSPTPTTPGQDTATKKAQPKAEEEKKEKKLPWHGTTFLLSQYATTPTLGMGKDYQSANPLYAWWMVFGPRYYFLEDDKQTFMLRLRFDVTLEMTNSDSTTRQYEAEFGNIWVLAPYSRTLYKEGAWVTKVSTGPRVLIPSAKSAWNAGTRLMPGWSLGVSQGFPLAGKGKSWFPSASVSASAAYTKYINKSTTPTNDSFERQMMDTSGRTFVSNTYGASMLANHQVLANVGVDLQITDKLNAFALNYWIMSWAYKPTETQVNISTGPTTPSGTQDPQSFRNLNWLYTGVEYEVIPQMSVGAGYYNLANQIGPDGKRRSILWSPDAVVFFDITANLDEIYSSIAGTKDSKETRKAGTAAIRAARQRNAETIMQNRPNLSL